MKNKAISFKNPRTGEVWICENLMNKRKVDDVEFIEVHKPQQTRLVWMNLSNLVKLKNNDFSK